MKVWGYSVKDPAVANPMLDLGTNGIITDNTAILWRTLVFRNITPGSPAADVEARIKYGCQRLRVALCAVSNNRPAEPGLSPPLSFPAKDLSAAAS